MAWPIGKLSAENKRSSEKTIEENSSKKKKKQVKTQSSRGKGNSKLHTCRDRVLRGGRK